MARIPDFFGIDLGNSGIKVCETRSRGNKFQINALGSLEVPNSIIDNTSTESLDQLGEKITEVVKNARIRTRAVVMSLPETVIFSRLITLPEVKGNLDEAIHWAIKPLVPVPIETLNISYLKIDEVKKNKGKYTNFYVVAAPRDLVQRYQTMMSKTKLQLLAVETEALAITRLLFKNYQLRDDALIIDIGSNSTNLMIVRNGVVVFSQSTGTSSDELTKVIASDYGLDETEAEKYKINYGLDFNQGDGKIAKSLQPVIDILITEISRTMTYYTSKLGGQKVQNIFLTGGGANLIKINEYVSSQLGVNVQTLNPINSGGYDKKLEEQISSRSLSSYNVAIGLSLKGKGN